jgi:hypothetical protein
MKKMSVIQQMHDHRISILLKEEFNMKNTDGRLYGFPVTDEEAAEIKNYLQNNRRVLTNNESSSDNED